MAQIIPVDFDNFKPVEFHVVDNDGRGGTKLAAFTRCIPAGDGIDVCYTSQNVYVMKERGKLRSVWRNDENNAYVTYLAFDGKYVWAPVSAAFRAASAPLSPALL